MNKLYNESDIQATAQAIRDRADIQDMLKVEDFADAIASIPSPSGTYSVTQNGSYNIEDYAQVSVNVAGGGGGDIIISKSITANGTYNAEDDEADGYDPVIVNVQPTLQDKTVTSNGTYSADEGYDGLDEVTVNVQPNLTPITFTANGTYTPTGGIDGFDSVTVNVSVPPSPSGTINITENGIVNVSAYQFANVEVEPDLETTTITTNGTYTPSAGKDGFSSVVVNVSGGGSEIKTGSFILETNQDCSVTPYTITHNLGKAPKYFFLWYGTAPNTGVANGINQIDYINDGQTTYHTLTRVVSSSARAYGFSSSDIEFNNNTVVIKNYIAMAKGSSNNAYHWVIA